MIGSVKLLSEFGFLLVFMVMEKNLELLILLFCTENVRFHPASLFFGFASAAGLSDSGTYSNLSARQM